MKNTRLFAETRLEPLLRVRQMLLGTALRAIPARQQRIRGNICAAVAELAAELSAELSAELLADLIGGTIGGTNGGTIGGPIGGTIGGAIGGTFSALAIQYPCPSGGFSTTTCQIGSLGDLPTGVRIKRSLSISHLSYKKIRLQINLPGGRELAGNGRVCCSGGLGGDMS